MNQQRSRRFRTAKDAEDAKRKAIAKGEELPEEEQFDRNCITPGKRRPSSDLVNNPNKHSMADIDG